MAGVTEINCCSCSNGCMDLPPGFRFHPTDEEITINYLREKVLNPSFSSTAIGEVDLNKCEPWDLPSNAKMGEKVCYFFCQRDRKYPTGIRTNRATEAGFWKATGKDKEICRGRGVLIGMKKTLVFYKGRAPRGKKTNWVMHEYRLEGQCSLSKSIKDSWVVCRVFHKNQTMKIKSSTLESVDSPASSTFNQNLDQDESLILQDNNQLNPYIVPTQTDPQNQCLKSTSMVNTAYLNQEHANLIIGEPTDMEMQCKLEQLSSQSMITASHDALLSHETNTEISSLNLDNNFESNWFFDYPEVNPFQDLNNIWNY